MSIFTFITLEKSIDGLSDELDGKGLAHCQIELDDLARQIGVRPLDEFISMDADQGAELLTEMTDEAGNPIEIPGEAWFSAVDGLSSIRRLLAYFATNLEALTKMKDEDGFDWADSVINDLREAERILVEADNNKVRFHLTCSY